MRKMSQNFEAQRRETFETFAELKKRGSTLPRTSIVEFYLLAEDEDAKWGPCEKALRALGYATERDEDSDTLIVATRSELTITPEAIWSEERKVIEVALKYDFHPDGWEFGFD